MKVFAPEKVWLVASTSTKPAIYVDAPTWYLARERAGGDPFLPDGDLRLALVRTEEDPICRPRMHCLRTCNGNFCTLPVYHVGDHFHPKDGWWSDKTLITGGHL